MPEKGAMVKQPEQLLHLTGLRQRVSIKPDRLGIGHPVPETKPQEAPYRDIAAQCPFGFYMNDSRSRT